jgi:hypothetical protein
MSYVNTIYGTTKCTIFTDTIQHYKVYDIYRYNTTLQSVRYLDTIQHYKVYDIYRYNTTLQSVRYLQIQYNTTKCMIFTDTIQHYKFLRKNVMLQFKPIFSHFFWLQCLSRN